MPSVIDSDWTREYREGMLTRRSMARRDYPPEPMWEPPCHPHHGYLLTVARDHDAYTEVCPAPGCNRIYFVTRRNAMRTDGQPGHDIQTRRSSR